VGLLSQFFARLLGNDSTPETLKEEPKMTKVLVLYHSMYGQIETMAQSVAEGAKLITR